MNNVKTATIVRTVLLVVALVNQVLTMLGYTTLPVSDAQISELITLSFTVFASLWAWWKNNSFTKEAIEADEVLARLKEGKN